ncbi:unnamed protein product [Gemmataceae bacterium]|nr:unnamed protein product [Gemmataceae bacterium]VTT96584.1 unnamed protein product [Gemmataceae bacterium]
MKLATLLASMLKFAPLAGVRTYVAAAGLVGLSVYQLSQGQVEQAVQSFTIALGLLGLRERIEAQTVPATTVTTVTTTATEPAPPPPPAL